MQGWCPAACIASVLSALRSGFESVGDAPIVSILLSKTHLRFLSYPKCTNWHVYRDAGGARAASHLIEWFMSNVCSRLRYAAGTYGYSSMPCSISAADCVYR